MSDDHDRRYGCRDGDAQTRSLSVPESYKATIRLLEPYLIKVDTLDICRNGCMIFRVPEDNEVQTCSDCNESRWVATSAFCRKPADVITIFRVSSRVQRLCEVQANLDLLQWQTTQHRKILLIGTVNANSEQQAPRRE